MCFFSPNVLLLESVESTPTILLVPILYWLSTGCGSIPIDTFLVGWTSIYQLFWGSLGTRVLTHPQLSSSQISWLVRSPLSFGITVHCTWPLRNGTFRWGGPRRRRRQGRQAARPHISIQGIARSKGSKHIWKPIQSPGFENKFLYPQNIHIKVATNGSLTTSNYWVNYWQYGLRVASLYPNFSLGMMFDSQCHHPQWLTRVGGYLPHKYSIWGEVCIPCHWIPTSSINHCWITIVGHSTFKWLFY